MKWKLAIKRREVSVTNCNLELSLDTFARHIAQKSGPKALCVRVLVILGDSRDEMSKTNSADDEEHHTSFRSLST